MKQQDNDNREDIQEDKGSLLCQLDMLHLKKMSLERIFSYTKLLQTMNHHHHHHHHPDSSNGKTDFNKFIESGITIETLRCLLYNHRESSLSNYVSDMILFHSSNQMEISKDETKRTDKFDATSLEKLLKTSYTLDWNQFSQEILLQQNTDLIKIPAGNQDEVKKFKAAASTLKKFILIIFKEIGHWRMAEYVKTFGDKKMSFLPGNAMYHVLELYDQKLYIASFAVCISYLERTIADLLLISKDVLKKKIDKNINHSPISDTNKESFVPRYHNNHNSVDQIDNCLAKKNKKQKAPPKLLRDPTIIYPSPFHDHSIKEIEQNVIQNVCYRQLKINDILISPELKILLGEDIVFLIRLFTGPIQSLNLRNLCWHGFLSEEEFHPGYCVFLFLLVMSLCELECFKKYIFDESLGQESDILQKKMPSRRQLARMDKMMESVEMCPKKFIRESFFFDQKNQQLFINVIGNEKAIWFKSLVNLIDRSSLVPLNRKNDWKMSFQFFMQNKNYECLVLLFPSIESSLRRIFVFSNQCPERLLTAETTTLYTTFDEILVSDIGDGICNKLTSEIGMGVIKALFDLLFWKEGPRLRDKLSHGSCHPFHMSRTLTERTVAIGIYLLLLYDVDNYGKEYVIQLHPLGFFVNICNYIENYKSIFHPFTLLQSELQEFHMIYCTFNYDFCIPKKEELQKIKEYEKLKNCSTLIYDQEKIMKVVRDFENVLLSKFKKSISRSLFSQKEFKEGSENNFNNSGSILDIREEIPRSFLSKVGNCQSRELTKVTVLRKVISWMKDYLLSIRKNIEQYRQRSMGAFNRPKQMYAKMIRNAKIFSQFAAFLGVCVEYCALSNEEEYVLRENAHHVSASLRTYAKLNIWDKALKLMDNFIDTCSNSVLCF